MITICVGNQKGGVGKTTTTLNLGHALADMGLRVLLIDLDPQSSLTIAAGAGDCEGRSMANVFEGNMPLSDILLDLGPGLQLAPGDIELSETELRLVSKLGREAVLFKALQPMARRFDYCLIDMPPSLGILAVNGLAASRWVLIPAIPQYLDLRAMGIFTRTINLVKKEINPDIEILGILPTFWDSRIKLHAEVIEAWEKSELDVLPVKIRRSIRIAEAPMTGGPITAYAPEIGESYKILAEVINGKASNTKHGQRK